MRTKLFSFPSTSLDDVLKYEETMLSYARSFANSRANHHKETRSISKITEDTMQGNKAKVAACLSNNRDPIEMVDWVFSGRYNDGYTYLGNEKKESYVIRCNPIDITDDKIKISFSKYKFKYVMVQIEKYNQYSEYTEFITYDSQDKLYFHLGRLSANNFKEPIDIDGNNVIFEFEIAPYREEGLMVLL